MRWKTICFAGLMILMNSCMQFRSTQKEIDEYFRDKMYPGVVRSYYVGRQKINYLTAGNDSLPLVVFIHGSPGSLDAFIHFLSDTTLLKKTQMISVDRPGFGESNFGYAEPSLEKQVDELKVILDRHKNGRPAYLVGHSLGGPIIARMAMDYPEMVDGLVFVAASIDPELEPDEWFRGPLATPFLKWMLPRSIRASNEEIYQLEPQLNQMLPMWSKITCPSVFIQGQQDDLVAPANADFAKKMIVNAPLEIVVVDSTNHFVPWTRPYLIRDAILKLASEKPSVN